MSQRAGSFPRYRPFSLGVDKPIRSRYIRLTNTTRDTAMNSDFLFNARPKGRLRRFWWLHGSSICFWATIIVLVAMVCLTVWLAFTVEYKR